MNSVKQKDSITIQVDTFQQFSEEIQNLCSNPPKWIFPEHIDILQYTLNAIPETFNASEVAPLFTSRKVSIKFECMEKDYKLILTKEKVQRSFLEKIDQSNTKT